MPAAPPYWGELPAPTVTRGNSLRRDQAEGRVRRGSNDLAIDTNMAGDRTSYPPLSQPRQNRFSSQTEKTEAPTLSTQSPFASPIASEFRGDGLAPRPPSFPYGADANQDFAERRRRRESKNREQNAEYEAIDSPPAAPDVPRAPPLSYKQPYGNGGPPNSFQPPRTRRRSDAPLSPAKIAAEESYRPNTVRTRGAPVEEALMRARLDSIGPETVRRGGSQRQRPRPDHIDLPTERKGSLNDVEALRRTGKDWAPDRSPLQRLELTLDSITKEEKRARVEEAELQEREAKADRGGEKLNQNSVRFRNRPVAKGTVDSTPKPEPQSLPEAGPVRSISDKRQDQLQRSGAVARERAVEAKVSPNSRTRDLDSEQRQPSIEVSPKADKGTTPQRGSSFRDRSNISAATGVAAGAAAAAAAGATTLGRSGSNKLKKNPPGDPWFKTRQEAEKQYTDVVPRRPSVSNHVQTSPKGEPSRNSTSRSYPPAFDKELPVLPQEAREVSIKRANVQDPESDEMDVKLMRRGTLSKIKRLTGESFPTEPLQDTGKGIQTEVVTINGVKYAVPPSAPENESPRDSEHHHHHISNVFHRHENTHGQGVYVPSRRLDEWKKGGVALLSGTLLDLEVNDQRADAEKDKFGWDAGNTARRRSSTKHRKAEAYDGEYDDSTVPTRFKPALFLKSGPMLRYCGLRKEKARSRISRDPPGDREIWRGSVMIVTQDSHSSYELAPTLRLFLQPMDLLPPPPAQVDGEELAPEYVDPIAGLPKIGRDGRTLYVRPVEDLEEAKDLSKEESENGLFEPNRSSHDGAGRKPTKPQYDGEKAGKYKEVRGFRLHSEQGVTFWRFNIEIELRDKQQRIAYRINRGPATGFWVPARGQPMNIMFHSCNGFSHGVDPDQFCGPDPMWRDVLNTHQTQPFHVMLGGGDQIYNDLVMYETTLYKQWTEIRNPLKREEAPFTSELQEELESFYLDRYCMWFSQGLFGLAVSQIPMVNVFDDHDIIDGFGSYPDHYMRSPTFSGLGAVAFKYYMLFQHQSSIDEGEETEPSWILGTQPGPYINELSRSMFMHLGRSIAFLGLDCRTERMYDEVVSAETYHKVFDRLQKEIIKGETKHLIVLVGIPVAYPRMVWLENILTSRAFEPIKAMGRAGLLSKKLLNHMDGGVEILDDLADHWTARKHKDERNWFIQELQDLAAEKSVRVTILGGDVHLGAIGQFYSNPKLGISKDQDFRYMPNIISSAIVNTPPPDTLADLLNKRNKVHHLDADTDEDMIPIFTHDVNGKPRNNKRLLNRRNWCSIRLYDPEFTPPQTPQTDGTVTPPPPKQGLFRRLSNTAPRYAPDASASAPQIHGATTPPRRQGLFRRLSNSGPKYAPDGSPSSPRRGLFGRREPKDNRPPLSNPAFFDRQGAAPRRGSMDSENPSVRKRSLSITRLFRRSSSKRRHDNGGINGYGSESEEEEYMSHDESPSGIRGGSGGSDYTAEDDGYFPSMPAPKGRTVDAHPRESATTSIAGATPQRGVPPQSRFHRMPTGLSEKQVKRGLGEINLEGGLDICLNMEISQKDPAGTTMPYRLLVPALWYDADATEERGRGAKKGLKWLGRKGREQEHEHEHEYEHEREESASSERD